MLVAISAIASLLSLVVPPTFIGLMGVLPIAIGIKKLLELRKKKNEVSKQALESSSSISFLTVAAALLQMVVTIPVSTLPYLQLTIAAAI